MRNITRLILEGFIVVAGVMTSPGQTPQQNAPTQRQDPPSLSRSLDRDSLRGILQRVSPYQFGDSRASLVELNAFIRSADSLPDGRAVLEEEFIGYLQRSGTPAARNFVISKLALVGGDRSVPFLTNLLADSSVREMALSALGTIPGSRADSALLRVATAGAGRMRIGAINALGDRKVEMAIAPLEEYALRPDTVLPEASVAALGRIGTGAAIEALQRVARTSSMSSGFAVKNALLKCADNLRIGGAGKQAAPIYSELMKAGELSSVRRAALRGVVLSEPDNAATALTKVFQSKDSSVLPVAVRLVREIPDINKVRAIAANLPGLPEAHQVQLLAALSPFRDADVQAHVVAVSKSKSPQVRSAAIKTLGAMGDARAAALLVSVAAASRGAEQKEARNSLVLLHAPGADDSLVALLSRTEGSMKIECIKAVGARATASAVSQLLQSARNPNGTIRLESAKALKAVADSSQLPALVDLLVHPRDPGDRRELELAIAAVARQMKDSSKQDAEVLRVYPSASDLATRTSLITVFGKIGAPASLPVLREALGDKNTEVRAAALRALSEWPTADPYPDLWRRATEAKEAAHRILALRGSVRLIGRDTTRPVDQTIKMYKDAMTIAPDDKERKLLLSAIGEVPSIGALRLVAGYANDKALYKEAEAATIKIAESLTRPMAHDAVPDLQKLAVTSKDTAIQSKARALVTAFERLDDYITTWEYAGPYAKAGAKLLHEWFAPELDGGPPAEWKPFSSKTNKERPWLMDFDQVFGGSNVVVYVRCNVWSDENQDARLEIGSDDGVKVWLNGVLVHTLDAIRGLSLGGDRVPVSLKQGWNTLMMKVNQTGGAWGACARVRARDGSHLNGIRASATPN